MGPVERLGEQAFDGFLRVSPGLPGTFDRSSFGSDLRALEVRRQTAHEPGDRS